MKNAFFVTASIACGKSTFIQIANSMGFQSISADEIAHEILDQYSLELAQIFLKFNTKNQKLLKENKKIDRKVLGDIVFSNKRQKKC